MVLSRDLFNELWSKFSWRLTTAVYPAWPRRWPTLIFFRVFVVLDDLERLTTATKVFAALGRKKRSLEEIGSS